MSRNAEKECIDAVEEREDQMRTHRQEYLASIGSQMTARRVVTLQEQNDRLKEALTLAAHVLFLLSDEVKALGLRAENVPDKIHAALAEHDE